MAESNIISLPLLQGSLVALGPWEALLGRGGYRVYPYQLGCMVRTGATVANGGTLNTHGKGEIAVNDFVMACQPVYYGDAALFVPDTTRIAKVTALAGSDDQLTLGEGTPITFAAGEWLLCLGADGVDPDYDASDLVIYDDNVGNNQNSNPYLITASGGWFRGWVSSGRQATDLLITDEAGTPRLVKVLHTLGPELIP